MSDNSKIEWTDSTWNPVTGCTKVSLGCDHCYAERVTERFHGKARRRFAAARWPLRNVWLGVSVEDQHWADVRVPALLDTPAAVRFLSCEPLLGHVSLHRYLPTGPSGAGNYPTGPFHPVESGRYFRDVGVNWVIVGGESGPGARPMHPRWARDLRDQCETAGVPYHFKQWGEWIPYEDDPQPPFLVSQHGDLIDGHLLPAALSDHEPIDRWWWPDPEDATYRRVGKHAAGRQLDGRTHDDYPAPAGRR